jgi:hypothetical protein
MTSPNNSDNSNPPTNNSIPPASNSSSLNNNQGSPANSENNSINSSTVPTLGSHSTPSHMVSGSHFGITPCGIRLIECTLDKTSWPADLVLDLWKYNWVEWSDRLSLLAQEQGFTPWLDGSLPCPDATLAPGENFIWKRNDGMLRGFIREYVHRADVYLIERLPTAHLMFEALRTRHEQQNANAQVVLLLKALQVEPTYKKSIRDSLAEIRTYHRRILAMGELKEDVLFAVLLLNSMKKHFGPLQQSILFSTPNLTSEIIITRLLEEEMLIHRRAALLA